MPKLAIQGKSGSFDEEETYMHLMINKNQRNRIAKTIITCNPSKFLFSNFCQLFIRYLVAISGYPLAVMRMLGI